MRFRKCLVPFIAALSLICTETYANDCYDEDDVPIWSLPPKEQIDGAVQMVRNLFRIRFNAYLINNDTICSNKELSEEIIKLVDEIFLKLVGVDCWENFAD